jgi:hypothetical protein
MILLSAQLESYRSLKDKTMKLVFETQELSPLMSGQIHENLQQFGYLAFKNEPFKDEEKIAIEAIKTDYEDTGKTPGQRLRNVLYRLWEKKPEGFTTFAGYYEHKVEQLLNHFKTKIDE